MHIPKKFQQEDTQELLKLMRDYPFATIITHTETGIEANHLPVSIVQSDDKLYLHAHIAKANPVWKLTQQASHVLVTFNGPNCYISPNHYPTKKETGRAVPTWNYVVVHVQGTITFIHDPDWLYNALNRLTSDHESDQPEPWSITDAPVSYIEKMLPAIVGIEIEINTIKGQWKLSQNQPEINQVSVIEALSATENQSQNNVAAMIKAHINTIDHNA